MQKTRSCSVDADLKKEQFSFQIKCLVNVVLKILYVPIMCHTINVRFYFLFLMFNDFLNIKECSL